MSSVEREMDPGPLDESDRESLLERFAAQNAKFAEEVRYEQEVNATLKRENEALRQRLVETGLTDGFGVDQPAVVARDMEVADLISSLEERMAQAPSPSHPRLRPTRR